MKQGSFKIICLIIWACIAVFSGYGQDGTISYESRILESFNGDSEYTWKAAASRFRTQTDELSYPMLTYVDAWPMAAFGNNRGSNAQEGLKSLGIRGGFDRRGYNWLDIYPTLSDDDEENPHEIRIPGTVRSIDMWVWGSNLRYYIEVYLRDYQGVVHAIRLGDISYPGWRNLRVNVPNHIPQTKRILPSYTGLDFIKFRIWTQPAERVDNFYIYFKQFRVLTDTFESLYDGNDLADPQFIEHLWSNGN